MAQIISIEKETGSLVITVVDKPVPPPEDPFVLVDSADKGVNGYQNNYQGAGWTDGVNVPGWYKGTLSYTGITDACDVMKLNGTGVELYTEKGPTHGIVGVSIDGLSEVMVDLYAPEFTPMVKVFASEKLTQALHTIKVRCTGTKNPLSTNVFLIVDLFKVFNPQPIPDIPVPPSTEVIVQPGQSIKQAVESVAAGKTVRLLESNNYSENQFSVPPNVSLKGAGKDKTSINFIGAMPQQSENAMVQVGTGVIVDGRQEISGFTIKGNYACNGGIMVNNRDNVKVLDVRVQETTYFGAWLKNALNPEFANSELINSSWASADWVTGELCIRRITNGLIHHNRFITNKVNTAGLSLKGYGIKSLWPDSVNDPNVLTNLKIYSNQFNLSKTSLWKNGQSPNIDIELHNTIYNGIEITDNDFSVMGVSAAAHRPTKSGILFIKGNRFNWSSTSHIELVCSDVLIKQNIFRGGCMMTANFQPNGKWINQVVEENDFVSNDVNIGWGGTFLIGPDGAAMTVTKNKITKGNYTLVKYMGVTGGVVVDTSNVIS